VLVVLHSALSGTPLDGHFAAKDAETVFVREVLGAQCAFALSTRLRA